MSGHTPGPWTCFFKHKYNEWHVAIPLPNSSIRLALFDDGVPGENPEADARLIAAAPELLEALKDLLSDTQHSTHDCGDEEWCPVIKARAAIAKAQGSPTCTSSGSSDTGTRS